MNGSLRAAWLFTISFEKSWRAWLSDKKRNSIWKFLFLLSNKFKKLFKDHNDKAFFIFPRFQNFLANVSNFPPSSTTDCHTYTMFVSAGSSGMNFNCCRMHRTVLCWQEHFSGHPIAFTLLKSEMLHNAISTRDNFLFTSFILFHFICCVHCLMISADPRKCTKLFITPAFLSFYAAQSDLII